VPGVPRFCHVLGQSNGLSCHALGVLADDDVLRVGFYRVCTNDFKFSGDFQIFIAISPPLNIILSPVVRAPGLGQHV
jgi:hypothetical protein